MLLTRVPLLPNKDLMLLGLGITLANVVNVPATAVTALFLAGGATIQFLHLIVFFVTTPIGIRKSEDVPEPTRIPS
jgi:fructose-1-phosphate kinase PfkB-like protein